MELHGEETYMDFNVAFLRLLGVWPERPLVGRLSVLMVSILAMYALFFYGFLRELYTNLHSFVNVTEALGIGFLCSITFVKVMTLVTNETELKKLLHILRHNFYMYEQRSNEEHRAIILKYEKQSKSLTIIFLLICILTASSFTALPLVDGVFFKNTENVTEEYIWKLPYKLAFPIDTTDSLNYWLLYLYHGYVGITHVCLIPACDNFVIALMSHACGQLQILQITLENLTEYAMRVVENNRGIDLKRSAVSLYSRINDQNADNQDVLLAIEDDTRGLHHAEDKERLQGVDNEDCPVLPGEEVNDEMWQRLKELIQHHQCIFKFLNSMEQIFNRMMLAQFFGSTIMYCTAAFHITLSSSADQSVKLVSMGGLVSGALLQLGMYCYFADRVKEESEAVGRAAYSCQWYIAPEGVKKSLRIIMMRCHMPPPLTIGKFVELSLDTYAQILKGSYTYFAMLNELND